MIWFTSDLHFFHDRIHGHCHGKVDKKINTDSKELRVDVGIDGNLANYDLISLEKLANHFIKNRKI